jgi:hypothetical protein
MGRGTRNSIQAAMDLPVALMAVYPAISTESPWKEQRAAMASFTNFPRALEVNGNKPFSTMSPRRKRTPRAAWFSTTRATSTAPNYGRTYNYGTVFELAHSGKVWTKSVIYSFTGGSDGASPVGGVVFDSAGKLFGVTEASAYELSTVGDAWKETTLFSFNENEINPTISLLVAPSILHRQSAQRRR